MKEGMKEGKRERDGRRELWGSGEKENGTAKRQMEGRKRKKLQ